MPIERTLQGLLGIFVVEGCIEWLHDCEAKRHADVRKGELPPNNMALALLYSLPELSEGLASLPASHPFHLYCEKPS